MADKVVKATEVVPKMAPGKEGTQGKLRRQRRPEITGIATGKMKKLIESAIVAGKALGHDPEVWQYQEYKKYRDGETDEIVRVEINAGSVRCKNCLQSAGVALYPPPKSSRKQISPTKTKPGRFNGRQISGEMVESYCPSNVEAVGDEDE